jgi:DNA repair exonuclease SbcCD ATPase subunit
MVKLLKQSSISLHFEKHKGSTGGLQRHNEREPGQRHSNKNIKPDRTKDNIFLKPKDDRTYGERVEDRLEAGYRGTKAVRKDAVKMVEATVQLGGDITKESEETQIEALKEAYEQIKEMYGEENIISAVIHVDETTPHLHCDFVPLTKRGNLSAKDVIGDKKKMRRTQEKFLEAMQERVPRAKFARLEPEKAQFNGLDQKLYEKMTASIKEREDKLCDREDYIEDQEIKLENKEEQLNQLKETLEAKENEIRARERQVEKDEDGIVFDRDALDAREAKMAEQAHELREREEAIAETASKLADKTRELNAREEDLDGRDEALRRAEGLAEARRAQELENARKEAERIKEDAREEAKGIIARATAKASAMMAQAKEMMAQAKEMVEQAKETLKKLPIVNKMMIGWAEKQEPEDRQATEDVLDAMTKYGVEEPREAFVESEDEQEQRDNLELLQAVTMLTEDDMDEAKETAETKGELTREDVHDILQGMQDLQDDSWQQ